MGVLMARPSSYRVEITPQKINAGCHPLQQRPWELLQRLCSGAARPNFNLRIATRTRRAREAQHCGSVCGYDAKAGEYFSRFNAR
jgi:hypothetical protein